MTARVLVPALAVALIIALALGGCGSDEETTTTGAVTTSVTEGTTTTTTVAPSTTSSSPTTSSVVTSESSTTTEASSTTTEALSSAETRLPNGNIKAMGYIDEVWEEGGTRYISIDYAEMLTGQEAVDAAVEAGYIAPGEDLPNDYFIRNDNPQKREFTVADRRFHHDGDVRRRDGGIGELGESSRASGRSSPRRAPTHLQRRCPGGSSGTATPVVKIAEQYLP